MKRQVRLMCMFAAMVVAAPVVMAGNDIVKCVDADGRVTLTDQPCGARAATVRLDQDKSMSQAGAPSQMQFQPQSQPDVQRRVLPAADLRQWRRPDLTRAAPLKQDVATLRAAHRMLMLQDARPTLAGLP
ncbi:DUF4124 domain-containing protein [Massilia sp. 9096]|uniref:DUF4124 domain-containing protein n=1 Tax=Massilia sp. 9096 TaxID=1500894 RepID=UPI0005660C36|nr:DUF4124 domain-containing protein [Massilia sp. 9096]